MKPAPDREARLEQWVRGTIRDLPPRPAPPTLELRVRAEIARRAARPWWRRSFAGWPVAARAGFLALALGAAAVVVVSGIWIGGGLEARLPAALDAAPGWLEHAWTVGRALHRCVAVAERAIPAGWLYGGLAVVASLYLTLFGLGAAAYRALLPRT